MKKSSDKKCPQCHCLHLVLASNSWFLDALDPEYQNLDSKNSNIYQCRNCAELFEHIG